MDKKKLELLNNVEASMAKLVYFVDTKEAKEDTVYLNKCLQDYFDSIDKLSYYVYNTK